MAARISSGTVQNGPREAPAPANIAGHDIARVSLTCEGVRLFKGHYSSCASAQSGSGLLDWKVCGHGEGKGVTISTAASRSEGSSILPRAPQAR